MSENKKYNPAILAAVFVVAAFILLEALSGIVNTLDASGYPETVAMLIGGVKWIFSTAPMAVAIGFGRNYVGYIINWIRAKRKNEPSAEYSMTWLSETVVKMQGWILLVTPFIEVIVTSVGPEYKQAATIIAGAIFVFFDMALSEIKRIKEITKPNA